METLGLGVPGPHNPSALFRHAVSAALPWPFYHVLLMLCYDQVSHFCMRWYTSEYQVDKLTRIHA